MTTKKIAKAQKVKRVRYYGILKIKKGQKLAWVSKENKHGWSLGLAVEKRTVWLRNVRFASLEEVERATTQLNTVYFHKAE